ncbi:MAG: FG-GAP-like repeat-containing protein [Planctomycetota bacterium]|nr:FG-GAP-like repeat-containing protein [Planctomycetota bacterium]
MYSFLGFEGKPLDGLRAEEVIAWYELHSPLDSWSLRPVPPPSAVGPIAFRKHGFSPAGAPPSPAISHLSFVAHEGIKAPTLLACDMRHGRVFRMTFRKGALKDKDPYFMPVGKVPHPCRVELCDLDQDGFPEILVADLGSFLPKDHHQGTVSLLRSRGGQELERIVLAKGLGRVSDVRSGDMDGDGDLDLVVGVFGWNETGQIFWMENRTGEAGRPKSLSFDFERHPIDPRHGVIHVPIADLDGDGRLDIVAQLSQEHEEVVWFRNRGKGDFEPRILDRATHPAWGSNGLVVADLDGDGDQDLVLSNGDSLDDMIFKTYHGLRWLENRGPGKSWKSREIAPMYAVHGVRVADLDGDGDQDLVAGAFLPPFHPKKDYPNYGFPSLVWFEQQSPGTFHPWIIERRHPFHAALDVGDVDGDGDLDLVVGSFWMDLRGVAWPPGSPWVEVWENLRR